MKKYQVFISSTYLDLVEERLAISRALLDINCIPVGMENFPATEESSYDYMKKIIDESDYYLVLIGGRYGSISGEKKKASHKLNMNMLWQGKFQ